LLASLLACLVSQWTDLSLDCFQRFRFCGDLDCPDWALAEISILSKLVMTLNIFSD